MNEEQPDSPSSFSSDDVRFMRRALKLAAQGHTPPNPMVGCVLVRRGHIVGEGFHPYAGQPHAEIFALQAAGAQSRGATAYVTLEPCSHFGRTPPCAAALIAAGIARVVIATLDSNPKVSGRGMEQLRAAGIETSVGVLETRARRLNEAFFHFHERGEPFLTLKAAMTLDGKIATHTGDSKWITGLEARRHVHELRARSGAVMVGVGTILADNASLDARLEGVELPRQPLRIVVDSHLRTPPAARAVRLAVENPEYLPLLIATTEPVGSERAKALKLPGVEVASLPANKEGRVELGALRKLLAQRQVTGVLCEGGGQLNASLLREGWAHKALFFVAPKLVGGNSSLSPVEGEGALCMADAWAIDRLRLRRFGQDVAMEGYFIQG